ncbi:MAG: hypothetical protein ACHQ53_04285 [Polyangiales bacterium]
MGCGSSDNTTGNPSSAPGTSTGSPSPTGSTVSGPSATNPTGAQAATNPQPTTGAAGVGGGGTAPTTGSTQMMPATPTNAPMPTGGMTTTMPMAGTAMAMNECGSLPGFPTQFAGDEYCILPPPADKGFQMHIGPSNYANPEAQYLLQPGEESTPTFSTTSGNTQQVYFYYRQIRQRPGAHHNIVTSGGGGDIGLGQRIATSNNLAEDDPKGGIIAPENMDVGISMPPNTPISVSLHSINTTQKVELREVWINFWYVDPSKVKEPVKEIFDIAPQNPIPPGADVTYGSSCTVSGTGRMLWMYGHRHANNVRFTVWRTRASKKDLVYQSYNYEEPLVLDYSSTVMNPVPDTGPNVEGGWSGILDMMTGDVFSWECHVINKQTVTLNFTNNTYTGEMCILDAESVGATCP